MSALLGLRFALGSRDGRIRTLLVALAAGAAIALLLLAVAVPHALAARGLRSAAREPQLLQAEDAHGLLWSDLDLTAGAGSVSGAILAVSSPTTLLPPGVRALPEPGTMLVSPALAADLPHDPLLAARLPYRVAGLLPDAQLLGPGDLRALANDPRLAAAGALVPSVIRFGDGSPPDPLNPVLALLLVIGVLVVLVPIGVVVALAGRFGAERRDRRLAALRLAGLGRRQVTAVLGVEALCGALAGTLVGAGLFLAGRQALAVVQVGSLSVFPADAVPPLPLALLVLVAVPATVVAAALAGLRGVLVEPLGVSRSAGRGRRRLRLRVLPLAAGAALLALAAVLSSPTRDLAVPLVAAGVALLLVGAVAVLPWAVERIAAAIPAGALPWRFARGRLVHGGRSTVRVVGAVAALLAGAIALQMLFAGLSASDSLRASGGAVTELETASPAAAERAVAAITPLAPATTLRVWAPVRGSRSREAEIVVGSCTALRALVALRRCGTGTAVLTAGEGDVRPADVLRLGRATWRVPRDIPRVGIGMSPNGGEYIDVLLVTPGTLPLAGTGSATVSAAPAPARLAAVVAAAVRQSPVVRVDVPGSQTTVYGRQFESVRHGLSLGLALVLLLVGGVLLVSLVDQLRERRAALAALAAIGMRRRAMSASVLWESAVPVLVGAVVATAVGAGLGLVLLRLMQRQPVPDPFVLVDVVLACAVPLAVSAAGLPFALRLMRPEGLRAE